MVAAKKKAIYQLKITLQNIRPPIWRRVQLPRDITLGQLHLIVQISMGWTNSHLHSFTIQGEDYGVATPEFAWDDMDINDEEQFKLNKIIPGEKFKFAYTYDFGDCWDHEILVEKVLDAQPDRKYPLCIKAKRACPPEDCGGTWGYQELLETLQDPKHPEHQERLEWLGGSFDSEAVDIDDINDVIREEFENLA